MNIMTMALLKAGLVTIEDAHRAMADRKKDLQWDFALQAEQDWISGRRRRKRRLSMEKLAADTAFLESFE